MRDQRLVHVVNMTYTRLRSYFNTSLYVTHLSWQNTVLPCINHLYSLHTTNMLWAHRLTQLSLWRRNVYTCLYTNDAVPTRLHISEVMMAYTWSKHTVLTVFYRQVTWPWWFVELILPRTCPHFLPSLTASVHGSLHIGRQMSRVGFNLPASCKPHFRVHTSATSFSWVEDPELKLLRA